MAPPGIEKVSDVGEMSVNPAGISPTLTPVTEFRLVPVTVTVVPTGPLVGDNGGVIVGVGTPQMPTRLTEAPGLAPLLTVPCVVPVKVPSRWNWVLMVTLPNTQSVTARL